MFSTGTFPGSTEPWLPPVTEIPALPSAPPHTEASQAFRQCQRWGEERVAPDFLHPQLLVGEGEMELW